jgi:hypothetical protein
MNTLGVKMDPTICESLHNATSTSTTSIVLVIIIIFVVANFATADAIVRRDTLHSASSSCSNCLGENGKIDEEKNEEFWRAFSKSSQQDNFLWVACHALHRTMRNL